MQAEMGTLIHVISALIALAAAGFTLYQAIESLIRHEASWKDSAVL